MSNASLHVRVHDDEAEAAVEIVMETEFSDQNDFAYVVGDLLQYTDDDVNAPTFSSSRTSGGIESDDKLSSCGTNDSLPGTTHILPGNNRNAESDVPKPTVLQSMLRFMCEVDSIPSKSAHLSAPFVSFVQALFIYEFFSPYLPPIERPGWLKYCVRMLRGMSYEREKMTQIIFEDVLAGFMVVVVLVPQSLAQATLAGLSPIYGLKSSIFPALMYVIFGCSMQMNIGPSSTTALLVGAILAKHNVTTDEEAIDLATQVSMVAGIVLVSMSILNLGYLLRFISVPVFTAYISAVALLIGISQLKNAFGFSCDMPQVGKNGVQYNYEVMQWYADNWNARYNDAQHGDRLYRNPYATQIFLVYFFVLFFIQRSKKFFSTPARAEMPWFRALMGLANMSPLLGIILASVYAWSLKSSDGGDYYSSQLSIVGSLSSVNTPDLFRVPSFKYPWGALFQDSLTVTVLLFYEGYAIAWKYARANNELSYLNPSQELFAVGAANMVGSMTSAFPVSGSFTRSAVGVEVGGRSPFVSLTCALLAVLVLYVLSPYLQYTPYSALAALIYVSLYNNLGLTEAYEAMRASPSDALAWIATFLVTFIVDTSIGLLAGIIVSFAAFLYVAVFSANNFPEASDIGPESNGVKLIRLNCDLSFLSVARMRDSFVEELFVNDGLQVMIVDFIDVKHIDLSAVKALRDIQLLADELKVKFITANVAPHITEKLHDFEIFLEGKGGGGGSEGKLVVRLKRGLEKYKNVKSFMNHRVAEELDLSKSLGALSAGSGLSTSSRRQGRFSLTRLASSLNDSLRGSRKGLGNSSSKSLRWKASNRPTQPFIPISYLAEKEKSLRSRKTVDKLSSDV